MKRIQITHNIVDENILGEVKRYLIAPWQKYMLVATGVVAIIASIINFMNKQNLMGVVLIALCGVCLFEVYWLSQRKYKDILKTMRDETEKEENIYTMVFGSDALTIRNCDMITDNKMPYDHMKRIVETQSTYTLFGKKNQFAVIRKDRLKMQAGELFEFLKAKDTRIKKWPNV